MLGQLANVIQMITSLGGYVAAAPTGRAVSSVSHNEHKRLSPILDDAEVIAIASLRMTKYFEMTESDASTKATDQVCGKETKNVQNTKDRKRNIVVRAMGTRVGLDFETWQDCNPTPTKGSETFAYGHLL
jgi:hypothetical protein